MARPIVGSMSEWSGVLKDLWRQIDDGSLRPSHLRRFLERKNPFVFSSDMPMWIDFYREVFDIKLPGHIPTIPGAHDEQVKRFGERSDATTVLVVSCDELSYPMLEKACMDYLNFKPGNYTVVRDVRNPANTYAVRHSSTGSSDITMRERLLYELFYWWVTGKKNAEVHGYCVCQGSITDKGTSPNLSWCGDVLHAGELGR